MQVAAAAATAGGAAAAGGGGGVAHCRGGLRSSEETRPSMSRCCLCVSRLFFCFNFVFWAPRRAALPHRPGVEPQVGRF